MITEARWIARQPRPFSYTAPAPHIRKTFTVEKEIQKAELSVCALGLGVCYINGKAITDDVLTTPVSNYDVSIYYNTYDVTSLMNKGKNAIGIALGNGIYNDDNDNWGMSHAVWRDIPKVILELVITYTDGTAGYVRSDSSFKTHDSPTSYNNARCGEDYDARLETDNWLIPDFDDSTWDRAVIKSGPGGILKPNTLPPIKKIRTIPAKHLGNNIYDLGENISGWVRFRVRGKEGDTVRVVYAERLNPDGSINNDNETDLIKSLNRVQSDNYILRGNGEEAWEPSFTYHGFRYFTLETNAELMEASGVLVHTDLTKVGDFECSDEILNKLHAATVKSTLTCYHGIPEDCPQREQNGWTGDAVISAEQAIMNFDMNTAYRQWLSDFRDRQCPSGQLPCIVPHPGSGWNGSYEGGPAWDGALVLIPYYIYEYTGDRTLIEENFDSMVRYLDYLDSVRDGYIIPVGLGDWNPPSRKRINHAITNTCYYHTVAKTVAECADILGYDSTPYLTLAANIRASYRERLINSTITDMNTQTALVCGIYHGMYESGEISEIANRLVKLIEDNDFHIDCGCLGTKAMFTVLTETGHTDVLLKMILNPTAPSYAYWIANGMTTLCERWYMDASHNHHYFSEIDFWFYKYVAGIRIEFGEITIAPVFVDGIDEVRAHHRDISVCYDSEKLVIEVPKAATLILDGKEIPIAAGKTEIMRN